MMNVYLKSLLSFIKNHKFLSTFVFLTLFLHAFLYITIQIIYKVIFDGIKEQTGLQVILVLIGITFIAAILRIFSLIVNDYFTGRLTLKAFNSIRFKLYNHLQWLSADYYQKTNLAEVISGYSHNLHNAEDTTRKVLPQIITSFFLITFSFIVLFYYEWRLSILIVIIFPLVMFFGTIFKKRTNELTRNNQIANAKIFSTIEEVTKQHLLLQAFNLQASFFKKFQTTVANYKQQFLKGIFFRSLMGRSTNIGLSSAEVIIFSISIILTYNNLMTIGTLFMFFSLVWIISTSILAISTLIPNIIEAGVSMHRLEELFKDKTDQPIISIDETNKELFTGLKEGIQFSGVSLTYDQKVSLKNISLFIKAGSSIAFVGHSGSGKTSLLSLIMGFYHPTNGKLFLDGKEITSIDHNSLRSHIGIVFQDNPLFNTTIRENIGVGKLGATDEEIILAAKNAQIHEFIISLPEGYNTVITEYGKNLSGGQRQRIAIARIFLRNPSILLLDEHSSALDVITESEINQIIKKLTQGRTQIMSTHRLDLLVNIDQIFFLEKGEVLESGNHNELLQKKGHYFKLWQKQHAIVLADEGTKAKISINYLRDIFLFKDIDEESLKEISEQFLVEWLDEGNVVFEKGSYGDKFYLIVRGIVEVRDSDKPTDEQVVSVLEEGDFFGEIALIKNVPRTHQVTTASHCIFLTLHRSQFEEFLKKEPHFRNRLIT